VDLMRVKQTIRITFAQLNMKSKVILGIDPGTQVLGAGVIKIENNKIELLYCDILKLKHLEEHGSRLKEIFNYMLKLIDTYKPSVIAAEAPFFGKNVQSMLKLGRSQGVALAAALFRDIPVFEYSPRKVKQSITGKGGASKEQVAELIKHILNEKQLNVPFDATDALAVGICHHFNSHPSDIESVVPSSNLKKTKSPKSKSSWAKFIQANPEKVIKKP
jgi:crossover junction endodeoxyribonuclease RuvC